MLDLVLKSSSLSFFSQVEHNVKGSVVYLILQTVPGSLPCELEGSRSSDPRAPPVTQRRLETVGSKSGIAHLPSWSSALWPVASFLLLLCNLF